MALIPPYFFDCVVAIGVRDKEGNPIWIGTGTMIAKLVKKREDGGGDYNIFIATNKHILKNRNVVIVRFNPKPELNKPAEDFDMELKDNKGNLLWEGHPDNEIDIGVVAINPEVLNERGIKYFGFRSDMDIIKKDQMIKNEFSEGDFVYVLGFPMGIVGGGRQYVISRSGSIARIKDLFDGLEKSFIIDAFVFPGNSGGPVVYKPEFVSVSKTKAYNSSGLIGIVQSYIPYQDIAISQQTNRPRITFEENSGLTKVIPIDYIFETIEIRTKKDEAITKKVKAKRPKKKSKSK